MAILVVASLFVVAGPAVPAGAVPAGADARCGDDLGRGASASAEPQGITTGPDGNLWFTNQFNNSIGRSTPTGVITFFTGTGIDSPSGIRGRSRRQHVVHQRHEQLDRPHHAGRGGLQRFKGAGTLAWPTGITTGPDGNLWFTNSQNHTIGRITPAGVVSNYSGVGIRGPHSIVVGPDGSLWSSPTSETARSAASPRAVPSRTSPARTLSYLSGMSRRAPTATYGS